MEVFDRLLKAFGIALVILTLMGLMLALMIWTKGLLVILGVFGVLVWHVYRVLAYRAKTMRRKDRKWGI